MSYTVTRTRGCVSIDRPVPLLDIGALLKAWGAEDDWIVDALLAQATGAVLVAGPRAACDAWRAELGLEPLKRLKRGERANSGTNPQPDGENAPEARYTIQEDDGAPSITCHTCGMTSYHRLDVRERYCAECDVFHDD